VQRTYWRIIRGPQARRDHFLSNDALGIPPIPNDPEAARLNGGVSLWSTETQARNKATRYPKLGTHLVSLSIAEDDGDVTVEKTLGRGHYTAWADPSVLQARVVQGSEVPV
jgi:hypothetical protein